MCEAITAINTAIDEAVAAQEAGDYRVALARIESAWMRICTMPDSEFEGESLTWSRDGIRNLMQWLQQRVNQQAGNEASASGRGSIIRPADVTYRRH
ncbi:hypothetical protein [Aureliella helgolandensis]|uniref:Uncharacterized protein n=1 Tax=Aureliella helgolandensis TaxID=2527968 RepID=A0A518G301_9BACT|nr:hypothetical protein [Aureliella helgolandensis]QDV22919.1 hypothetical protein Q31a_12120 [Aureliella helgolandensis]